MSRRIVLLAVMAAVTLPLVVGCQFLVFKVCVKNETSYYLDEFTVKVHDASTYPGGVIADLAPGTSSSSSGYSADTYDFRAKFDVSDPSICEDIVELTDVPIESTNLCITYQVQSILGKADSCTGEIYATIDYVL